MTRFIIRAFGALLLGLSAAAAETQPPADSASARAGQPARDSAAVELQEKSVYGSGTRTHRDKEISRLRLDREALRQVAAAQGDPMKALATLPGAANQNDMSVRPFVRGGKAEETQVLWEGVPLLQPYHFGSIYSVFNIESLNSMTLYSGGFPADVGNALSGALSMQARSAPLDTMALSTDLSMLRGNAYAGVPLWKDKLGISLAYQAFWYDWVFARGLDLMGLASDDEGFQRDKDHIEKYYDLPNFRDLQGGLSWKVSDRLYGEYTGLISHDIFKINEPKRHRFVNGQEVSPDFYRWDLYYGKSGDLREQRSLVDTLALVNVDNAVHAMAVHWKPGEDWQVDQTLAYQSQDWHVGFFDEAVWIDSIGPDDRFIGYRVPAPSDKRLAIRNTTYDWRLDAKGYLGPDFRLGLGVSQSIRRSRFNADLPRSIFEVIVNGNVDRLDALGLLAPEGLTLRKGQAGVDPDKDYLDLLPGLIGFEHRGSLYAEFPAAYVTGEYAFDPGTRLQLGLRGENDTYAQRPFLSPRASFFKTVGPKDEAALATGLYSQSDFPFQVRSVNPELRSEKAFHFNAEWTHAFSPAYRLECAFFQKNYFDLVVPYAVNTGTIDWHSGPMAGGDSAAFEASPKSYRDSVTDRFGNRVLAYRNGGTGKASGYEISLFYDPTATWGGWLTAEAGYSKRRDAPGGPLYDFRYHRPWAFNWVNRFKLPNRFAFAMRARFAAGLPYTDYVSIGGNGEDLGGGFGTKVDGPIDTVFSSGQRNGARYSPYSRWDLRLSREYPVGRRHRIETYFELWNAFNTPNFLLSDARTKEWKFVDLNYPFPILFLGVSGRW